MKRGPLRRKTRLSRKVRIGPGERSKYAARPRDIAYMLFVKTQPCSALDIARMPWLPFPPDARTARAARCEGPIEADHMGSRPVGRKAADDTCVPLCRYHHVARTGHSGLFRDATQEQLRTWTAWWIDETRRRRAIGY